MSPSSMSNKAASRNSNRVMSTSKGGKKGKKKLTDSSKKRKMERRERSSIVADDFGMTIVIQSPDTPVDPETPIEKKIVRKMNAVAGGGKTKANRNNGKKNKKSIIPTIPITKKTRSEALHAYSTGRDSVRTNLNVDVQSQSTTSSLMKSTTSISSSSSSSSSRSSIPSAPPRVPLGNNEVMISTDYLLKKQSTPLTFHLQSPIERDVNANANKSKGEDGGKKEAAKPPNKSKPSKREAPHTARASIPESPSSSVDGLLNEENLLVDVSHEIARDIMRASKRMAGKGSVSKGGKVETPESVKRRMRMEGMGKGKDINGKTDVDMRAGNGDVSATLVRFFRVLFWVTVVGITVMGTGKYVHYDEGGLNDGMDGNGGAEGSEDKVILLPSPSHPTSGSKRWFIDTPVSPELSPTPETIRKSSSSSSPLPNEYDINGDDNVLVVVVNSRPLMPFRRVLNSVRDDIVSGGVKEAVRFVVVTSLINVVMGGVTGYNPVVKRIVGRVGIVGLRVKGWRGWRIVGKGVKGLGGRIGMWVKGRI